jgi:hypothetical protein
MAPPDSGGTKREALVIYNDDKNRLQHWDGSRWWESVGRAVGAEFDASNASAPVASSGSPITLMSGPTKGTYRVTVYGVTKVQLTQNHTIHVTWTDERGSQDAALILGRQVTDKPVSESFPAFINSGDLKFWTEGTVGTNGRFAFHVRVESLP